MSRALVLFLVPAVAMGQGIGLGVWVDAINISETKAYLLEMAEDSLVLADLVTAVPDSLPFPLLGGFVSLPMPVGALEVEIAFLTDGILRALGIWPQGGLDLVEPPLHVDFRLSTYHWALAWWGRLDLGIFAAGVGAGVAVIGGGIAPTITSDDPDVQAILAEIPWEGMVWSAGGGTLSAGAELGPLLRLFVRGELFFPVFQAPGAWRIRVAGFGASAGFVLRF